MAAGQDGVSPIIILCDVYITSEGEGWGKTKANSISALLKSAALIAYGWAASPS